MNTLCECAHWARADINLGLKNSDGIPLIPNHHPNCCRYNDSLMDVWKVSVGGSSCYVDNEQDAKDTAGLECDPADQALIEKIQMHREIFENLPEFNGF